MAKVRARFRTRTKEYFYKDKYRTKTFDVELPLSDFMKECRFVNMDALTKVIRDLIDTECPDTYNTLLNYQIL